MTGRITGGRLSVAAALATAMAIGLQACGGGTGGEAVDEDQDGFAAEEDCNDNDATVHPGADELCNGVDDDCDGTEDEDAVDAATWHADEDSDGYGDPDATRQACEQSSGTVADSTDCDDADADVHPGADELCNRADDDCDGTEDEDATDQATWFVDGDTDGYGDPDAARQACEQPPGTVTDSTDCDDSEGEVHPAADERCNGLDDNCDAVTDSDAVDRSTWYLDGDSDEYGDPLVSQIGCEQPAGYLADSTDCDDGAPDVNPGEVEICDNSVDEDCDGTADDGCAVRHCGDITVDTVWDASAPHVVTCDILVEGTSGPTLTVEDGALVMFEAGVRMIVGGWNTGTIVVEGTSAGVTFTSASPTPTPGIWQGLQIGLFDQGSTLTGLTIEYGGGNGLGTLYLYNSQPVLDGVTVRHSSRDGVNGVTAFPLIRNSTFSDNAEDGIYLDANSGLDRSASPTFSGNVLTRNGEYAMSVPADYAGELDSSSTFTGNATDRIRLLADTVATTQTWLGQDVPYFVDGDVLVEGVAAPVLTVGDGATVLFGPTVRMIVAGWDDGSLIIDGASTGVTFGSGAAVPAPGDWQGLQIGLFDQGSTLTGFTIEYGGGNGLGTLYLYNSQPVLDGVTVRHSSRDGVNGVTAFPLIRNSTFSDNAEDGIYLDTNSGLDRTASPTFSGNVLTRNGEYAMSVPADYAGELDSSSTFTGNATDRIRLLADTVATTQTWLGQDVPYFVEGEVLVEGAAAPVLTVGGGATVLFGPTIRMIVAGWDDGSLIVDGASTGVTFGSGAAVPAPGDWQGLQIGLFDQGSTLTGLTIEYGGGNGLGTLYLYNSQPVLDGVTVRHSSRDGVNGVTAFPLIRNSTFSDNAEDGIYLDTNSGLDRSASPTFSGNVLTRNGEYAMSVPADYAGEIDSTSTFTGNTFDFIRLLADTVSVSQTWQAQDVPFLGSGEILVEGASGPALTVEDGAVVRFDAGVRMIVGGWNNGSLFVDGHTAGVVFSSRASPGTPGAWQGLQLGDRCNDAATVLDGLTIEYGGANGLGNVYFYQCDGAISNSTVRYSSTWGIYRVSSSPSIAGVTYLGNTAGDLF